MATPMVDAGLAFAAAQLVTKAKAALEAWLNKDACASGDALLDRPTKVSEVAKNLAAVPHFNAQLYTRFAGGAETEFTGKNKSKNRAAMPNRNDNEAETDGHPHPPTNLYSLLVASVAFKFGSQTASRGDELRQLDLANFTRVGNWLDKRYFVRPETQVTFLTLLVLVQYTFHVRGAKCFFLRVIIWSCLDCN